MSHISLNYMLKLMLKSKYICTRIYRCFLELFFLGEIFLNLASLQNTPLTSLSKKSHTFYKKNCSMFLNISLLICKKKCWPCFFLREYWKTMLYYKEFSKTVYNLITVKKKRTKESKWSVNVGAIIRLFERIFTIENEFHLK